MMFVWLLCSLSVRIALAQGVSHWMVTETGLVQPRDSSPFEMENPYDLLSFLNQDTRWENIFNIYYNLIRRQKNINKLWMNIEDDSKFEQYMAENEACAKVESVNSIDWYTSYHEDGKLKGIPEKDFALQRSEYGDTEVPDCKKISSLTFSMFAFEHLDSMINRDNLSTTPEWVLPEMFTPMSVDQFGHWVSDVLRKNSTSWLHYNLAAIYWRIKGIVPKAIECSRRSIHYAPRQHKDIPLLCLGSILHRSNHSEDAAVVLSAAVDHDANFPINHFALGAALAVIGDFNNSLTHLGYSMKLRTTFEAAERYMNGVLCHIDMLKKMQIVRRSKKILTDALKDYTDLESQWLKIHIAFLKTMKLEAHYDYSDFDANCVKMGEITGLNIPALKKDGDRNTLALYFLGSPTYTYEWLRQKGTAALETALGLERIVKHLGKHAGLPTKEYLATDDSRNVTEILNEIGPMPYFPDVFPDPTGKPLLKTSLTLENPVMENKLGNKDKGTSKQDSGKLLYPSNFKVNRNRELFDTDPDFPSDKFCQENTGKYLEDLELIYPVFMPFHNKGIKLDNLLSDGIGVPVIAEHELPWHPPTCPTDKDLAIYTSKRGLRVQMMPEHISKGVLRRHLFKYLSDTHLEFVKHMPEAEIGQRIQTAIEKKLASKWVLYTLASLYWRVRGNIPAALNCLLTAGRSADARHRDVVLVSTASVFLEMGLLDECSKFAEEAYKMSPYEPSTNFLLAQLFMLRKSHKAQLFHLKQAVRVEARHAGGAARRVLAGWACLLKHVDSLSEFAGRTQAVRVEARHAGGAARRVLAGWACLLKHVDSLSEFAGFFPEMGENEICADVEPGVSMVCERDGTNCHISNRDCKSVQKRETSQIVRILELKDDTIQGRAFTGDEVTSAMFDELIAEYPAARTHKAPHLRNYREMARVVDVGRRGCGEKGCGRIEAEDLGIKAEDCSHQHLQLDYWLHVICFSQHLTEAMRLSAELTELTTSKKSVPECKLPAGWADDFFLEQIMKVDTSGWEPILRLMHQFSEIYNAFDFNEMGARLAIHVDNKPQSWDVLMAAGWWCGAGGRGGCAARCLAAAFAAAPPRHRAQALRKLLGLLHVQSKQTDSMNIAYLSLYSTPKSKVEAFLVALAHTYRSEYEHAVWMYRYTLSFDSQYLPAKACIHISMCFILYGDVMKQKNEKLA